MSGRDYCRPRDSGGGCLPPLGSLHQKFNWRQDQDLKQVEHRAERRVGRLSVVGRYHGLPKRITDDYDLGGKALGSGYNGTVFSATNRHSGMPCAVKSFGLKGITADKKKELCGEVEIFLAMDHPHVARLLEVYESETEVSLVMECMSGGELYDRIAECKVFGEKDAAQAAYQMLLAISYIHNEGVVHRDLKLENFLYDKEGSDFLKLIDFGFSKFYEKDTKMVESLGTVTYVSPEVLAKSYSCGSCDLWSFGVIVFVLLSGYMPFAGQADADIIRKIKKGDYHMKPARWGSVSEAGVDFVRKLLVVTPKQRLTAEQALAHPWIASRRSRKTEEVAVAEHSLAEAFSQYAKASRFHQVCARMMAWSLSLDERRKLRSSFLEMDQQHTGVIQLEDVKVFLKGKYASEAEFEQVFQAIQALDVDKDGEIHYSDFLAATLASQLDDHGDALQSAFRAFDVEQDGYVSCKSLETILKDEMSAEEVQVIFQEMDANGDGKISHNEFVSYLRTNGASEKLQEAPVVKGRGCLTRRSY